ncbi:hypothetical protein R3I93_019808 [Phoxinus phoxinus]|uniref:Uncharacterized protein n=1 Tax=Phoxinus phoxinus TaxID=58324 RepID=A0AAN9CED4_9TELE
MSKRPKPSGAQGRKKRREEEEKRKKDRDALLKYLNPVPANPGPPVADISISAPPSDSASSTSLPSTSAMFL